MLILGIESTCDETACALVKDGREILSNIVSSQVDLHAEFGGVVPELACRRHVEALIPVLDEALKAAGVTLDDVDAIAVAHSPGLIGALLIGINAAKALAFSLKKPFIGINHIEAHLYASIMSSSTELQFPALGIVLSGGHTSLMHLTSPHQSTIIAKTVDDAVGEAFDKVAKILGLSYPGGPEIERLALAGDPTRFSFKAGRVKESPLDFSFSGLKTAVLYASRKLPTITYQDQCDLAAGFQQTAFSDVLQKTLQAARLHQCQTLLFGGGVTNNKKLRNLFEKEALGYRLLWPAAGLSLDNAAMIAGLGFHKLQQKKGGDLLNFEAIATS